MMNILVAVIAFNEEKNIKKTINDLMDHNSGYDIIVIDNGSTDNTVKICEEMGVSVISHCINSGGAAGTVMTYFLYAYLNNYDILCQFDGDGQHLASELHKIINPIQKGEADYIIGSRYIKKEGFQSSFLRRLGIRLFSFLDSKLIGQKVTDVTSGFRAYGKRTIEFFAKYYRHEIYDTSQLLLLSHFSGSVIKEVPVIMKEREFGVSEFDRISSILFTFKGLINIIGCTLQIKQIKRYIRDTHGD